MANGFAAIIERRRSDMSRSDSMQAKGAWEVRRDIRIPALDRETDAAMIERALTGVPGVRKVAFDLAKHRVTVRYDATGADYRSIIAILERTGFPPPNNHWSRLREAWCQYSDTTARENANVRPSACCNKPPK
jgi:copper chaperone CopZ